MSKTRQYKLPDGTYGTQKKYIKEWKKIRKEVEYFLDCRVLSMDPGIMITDKKGNDTASLPPWFVRKILNLASSARNRDEEIKELRFLVKRPFA